MRILKFLTLILMLSGCVKHHSEGDFDDIALIEKSAIEILDTHSNNSIVNIEELPLPLSKLKPYYVRIDETGIYIKLDESFVSESGIYISREGYAPNLSDGIDPSFKLLKNRTYSYLVKG